MSKILPSIIFDGTVHTDPWQYTVSEQIDEHTLNDLQIFMNQQDWSRAEVDPDTRVETITINDWDFDRTDIPYAGVFLQQMQSSKFHRQILKHYNLPIYNYTSSLVIDRCPPNSFNDSHNDMHGNKDVVTLQFYIGLDDANRAIKVDHELTDIGAGQGMMFKSSLHTWHSFDAGHGYRYSVRLRLRHKLIDPKNLHMHTDDNIGVIIDCKDMETGYGPDDLEHRLGRLTYESCKQAGFTNIVVFDKMDDWETALDTQKADKVLVLFAGALLGDTTYDYVVTQRVQCGNIISKDRIARQFFLFDKSKLQGPLNNKGNYLSEQVSNTVHTELEDIDIFYEHPDDDTREIIDGMMGFEPHLLGIYSGTLLELFDKSSNK